MAFSRLQSTIWQSLLLYCLFLAWFCYYSVLLTHRLFSVLSNPGHCNLEWYIESQNWVGRDIKDQLILPPPAIGRDTFQQNSLLKTPCNLALNTFRDEAPTATLGNLVQCLKYDWMKLKTSNKPLQELWLWWPPAGLECKVTVTGGIYQQ